MADYASLIRGTRYELRDGLFDQIIVGKDWHPSLKGPVAAAKATGFSPPKKARRIVQIQLARRAD
jgi:hypothetical protein